ncbi:MULTISPECIES: hypothetical protein [unclassified Nocardioides]|uniref:hypothetical protein n=1 Tax=unclassified Nocardioides TaxID=2615069 RepID=UPI0006FAD6B5|nr:MULTISPECIES: hypothetical protein [unclassified Nocardioides]KQY64001.1 hypothetical protein ASD30_03250 [Nocardioides sp. Root140]KRF16014.1 hypothetical protein ASH02_05255 [Nocardioides sp. Soil796]
MASERKALIRDALVIVAVFVVAGAVGGWFWHHLWAPAPKGFALEGVPHFEDDADFRGTGLYVAIAAGLGLVIGIVVSFVFERDELVTLGSVVVGALLGGVVLLAVGQALGPDSAIEAAKHTKDWDPVTGDLHASWLPVLVSCPGGALLGTVVVLTCFNRRRETEPSG